MIKFDLNTYKDFIRNNPYEYTQQKFYKAAESSIQTEKKQKTISQTNVSLTEIKDEFLHVKKSRGLFEKVYDFCKNITNFGSGSKKIEKQIKLAEAGNFSEEELKNNIEKYKYSNTNARQTFGDTVSCLAALGSFFGITNAIKMLDTRFKIKAEDGSKLVTILKAIFPDKLHFDTTGKIIKTTKSPVMETFKKLVSSGSVKTKLLFAIPTAIIVGGLTKYLTLKINRIGSKEYEITNKKTPDKREYRKQKKIMNSKKRAESFKNLWTGMINGLISPITMIAGGIIGVPLYVLSTFGIRYSLSESKNKSLSDFTKKLADNWAFNTVMALALGIPAFKTARYSHILNKNLSEISKKLEGVELKAPELAHVKGAFKEIEEGLMSSPKIEKIMNNNSLSMEEKIQKLSDENIFSLKFKQIAQNGDELTRALREQCPATRTIQEAGQEIEKLLGNKDYKVTKCLGVGTIAETYLATDKSGKEVAIKILKKGINKEKILADKEKLLNIITKGVPDAKLSSKQIYLKKNIENLAEGVLKEIDLKNECEAAKQLAKVTKKAKVVVPIFAKEGVYVMEKANGISVSALYEYAQAKTTLERCKSRIAKGMQNEYTAIRLKEAENAIAKIKAKSPAFEDFDITPNQIKKIIKEYMNLHTEQFVKLNKNGKIIHGDIHPGNIFIDLDVLKGKKGKLFTLIDTGNTINLTKEQTKDALKLIGYIKNGNYKDIARVVTESSILPDNLTREQAREFVEKELKKYFTDTTHKLGKMTTDTMFELTNAIQAEKGIIPCDTQLSLVKSKQSALNSFNDLMSSFGNLKFGNIDESSKAEIAKTVAVATKDMADICIKMLTNNKIQETKNLFQMSFKEVCEFLRNKNMLPSNSMEHLVYKLKQDINSGINQF